MLKRKLTEQDIYNKTDDIQIFHYYFGKFDFDTAYPSKFRVDKNPSTGFFQLPNGRVIYNDFARGEKLGAIQFVQKLFGLNYGQAIDRIAEDFGIIEGNGIRPVIATRASYTSKKNKTKIIKVVADKWRIEHLDYWKQFCISKKELNENFVYPVKELLINHKLIYNSENILRFAYYVKDLNGNESLKIYSPYDNKYKWISSISIDTPFGIADLPFASKTLIITKGQKDRIIWKKFCSDVIATQNESKEALNEKTIELINNKYDNVYVNFDCDIAGITASKYFSETYGWKWINVPNIYYTKYGIKDFADLVKDKGLDLFKQYITWKKII